MGRRSKNIAKKLLYDAFRGFIEAGNAKATISEIVEVTGMNRKTFYNHFASRDELVAWGFRHDLAEALSSRRDVEALEFPTNDYYGFTDLPCYYRIQSGTSSFDQSQYFRDVYDVFRAHKRYYRALLRTELAEPFCRYLVTMFQELFYDDITLFLRGRKMPENAKRYIAAFFAEGIVHHISDSLAGNLPTRLDVEGISPVNNLIHSSMHHLVEAYQDEKTQAYFRKIY